MNRHAKDSRAAVPAAVAEGRALSSPVPRVSAGPEGAEAAHPSADRHLPDFPAGKGPRVLLTHTSEAALLAEVTRRLSRAEGFTLATLNLDHLVKLDRDPAFARAYAAHDMVVADGNPVVWLARLAARPVGLVPGSDLVVPLARAAAATATPVALVGATDETLANASEALRAAAPGLEVVACIAPLQGFDPDGPEADAVIESLRSSGARLCLLALGAPRQELFAARARAALPAAGFASIGAGLDFVAGHHRRAPLWVRRLAMEWFWRLAREPRRLGLRYLRCALILPRLALDARAARRRGP